MNTTAKRMQEETAHASASLPILMRLPDLREPETIPTLPAVVVPQEAASPELAQAAIAESIEQTIATAPAIAEAASIPVEPAPQSAATIAPTEEPKSTASSRRQRAQERMKRQQVEATPTRSWWRTQAPTILILFVIALGFTLYMARKNREANRPAPETWVNEETPLLDIVPGEAKPAELPVIETTPAEAKSIAETPPASPATKEAPKKKETKLPSLLSTESVVATNEKPVAEQPAAAKTSDLNVGYPHSEADAFRPGGRMAVLPTPSTPNEKNNPAETPAYPTTQFPSTWR